MVSGVFLASLLSSSVTSAPGGGERISIPPRDGASAPDDKITASRIAASVAAATAMIAARTPRLSGGRPSEIGALTPALPVGGPCGHGSADGGQTCWPLG